MAHENHDNVYYKFGMVKPDPKLATEQRCITARFEVGPAGAQISLAELKAAAGGKGIQKRHFDGQTAHERIDAGIAVGSGQFAFTKNELAEIYEIEKAKADERAKQVAATKPVAAETVDELKKLIEAQQKQINALAKAQESAEKEPAGAAQ